MVMMASNDGAGGASGTRDSVTKAFEALRTAVKNAQTVDDAEFSQASTGKGEPSAEFTQWLTTLKKDISTAWADTEKQWDVFEPHLDAPEELKKQADQWFDAHGKVDFVNSDIDKAHTHDAEYWQSKGGAEVWKALEVQKKALTELSHIAEQQGSTLTYTGLTHGAINSALETSLDWAKCIIPTDPANASATSFYRRTDSARAALNALNKWMGTCATGDGEWGTTATQIKDQLNEVKHSVKVIKDGGQWPEAKALSVGDANTSQQVNAFTVYTESDGDGSRSQGHEAGFTGGGGGGGGGGKESMQ